MEIFLPTFNLPSEVECPTGVLCLAVVPINTLVRVKTIIIRAKVSSSPKNYIKIKNLSYVNHLNWPVILNKLLKIKDRRMDRKTGTGFFLPWPVSSKCSLERNNLRMTCSPISQWFCCSNFVWRGHISCTLSFNDFHFWQRMCIFNYCKRMWLEL